MLFVFFFSVENLYDIFIYNQNHVKEIHVYKLFISQKNKTKTFVKSEAIVVLMKTLII